jgi:hypothetical protein
LLIITKETGSISPEWTTAARVAATAAAAAVIAEVRPHSFKTKQWGKRLWDINSLQAFFTLKPYFQQIYALHKMYCLSTAFLL